MTTHRNDMTVNNSISSAISNGLEFSTSRARNTADKTFDEVLSNSSRNFSNANSKKADKSDYRYEESNTIQFGFVANNTQTNSIEANNRAAVGGRKTNDGISTRGNEEYSRSNESRSTSSWERTKELKEKATRCTPGMGSGAEDKSKASTRMESRGMVLNGRSAGLRADGTPTMTDDHGNIRVLNAKNPEMSIADLIQNQGVDDEKLEAFKHQLANQKVKADNAPKTTADSYVAQSENVKEKITEKLGSSAKDNIEKAEFTDKMAETESKTDTARPVTDASKTTSKYADKKAHNNEMLQQETTKTEQKLEAETQEKKTRLVFAQTNKDGAKVAGLSAVNKQSAASSVQSAQTLTTPQLSVEATQLAASLKGSNQVQSAKHLADLLGARMEFIAQNAKPTVNINLNPRQLGDIQIKLIANGENSIARIHADKESVGKALEIAAPQLAQQLQKVGFQVETVMVDYGEMSFDQQQFNHANEGNGDNPFDELFGQGFDNGGVDSIQDTGKARISTHDGEIDVVA